MLQYLLAKVSESPKMAALSVFFLTVFIFFTGVLVAMPSVKPAAPAKPDIPIEEFLRAAADSYTYADKVCWDETNEGLLMHFSDKEVDSENRGWWFVDGDIFITLSNNTIAYNAGNEHTFKLRGVETTGLTCKDDQSKR